jgi:hypothetical protein
MTGRLENSLSHMQKYIGSLKFGVSTIALFTLCMIAGTLLESTLGTDFANRFLYKSWWFFLLQFMMSLSIIFAALLRLPPKKRLYGFYVIHTGLITMAAGSFITYYAGVDGNITLYPNENQKEIELNKDVVVFRYPAQNKQVVYELPYTAFEKHLNATYDNIKIQEFLPFADSHLEWMTSPFNSDQNTNKYLSAQYLIENPNVSQDFVLSTHPYALDYQSTTQMGLLNIHLMAKSTYQCFAENNPSEIFFWNTQTAECFTPEKLKISGQKTLQGTRFYVFKRDGKLLTFLPEKAPWPMNLTNEKEASANEASPWRVFSKLIFKEKPHLFLFGKSFVAWDKNATPAKWISGEISDKGSELPWMNFKLSIIHLDEEKYPSLVPSYVSPKQMNGTLIAGAQRALKIEVNGQSFWITNDRPLEFVHNDEKLIVQLKKKTLNLPFALTLSEFKMDKDPGTNNPASYESFVKIFDINTNSRGASHHVYMNNPMKYLGFTFYQASYFPLDEAQTTYGSVLSANVDQGRFFKYLGALFLVFGSIWHHFLNRNRKY